MILVINKTNPIDYLLLYVEEVLFFLALWFIISKLFKSSNILIWNMIIYFLTISFLILTRLDYSAGVRQFRVSLLGLLAALITIYIIQKVHFLSSLYWLYIIIVFGLLFLVNDSINGAMNWYTIGNFTFQPSEIVKVFYILLIGSLFHKGISKAKIIISLCLTGFIIIILIYQKDLGTALIFGFLYITLMYLITQKAYVFFGGIGLGILSGYIANLFYSHVQVRFEAWLNPWENIDTKGYQITQSLFAIKAGGLIGTGLTKGMPYMVPIVMTDFIFSAICEEFGNIFSILLIGLYIILFISIMALSLKTQNNFYYIVSAGIGLIIAFQSFLIIGGVTKLIPSTGVTLPFISQGGTSLIVCCVMIGIIQGIYMMESKENSSYEEKVDEDE